MLSTDRGASLDQPHTHINNYHIRQTIKNKYESKKCALQLTAWKLSRFADTCLEMGVAIMRACKADLDWATQPTLLA